jgi:hypothetical protein
MRLKFSAVFPRGTGSALFMPGKEDARMKNNKNLLLAVALFGAASLSAGCAARDVDVSQRGGVRTDTDVESNSSSSSSRSQTQQDQNKKERSSTTSGASGSGAYSGSGSSSRSYSGSGS